MTTKEKIAVMQAAEDGAEIERLYYRSHFEWTFKPDGDEWNWNDFHYRVKQVPCPPRQALMTVSSMTWNDGGQPCAIDVECFPLLSGVNRSAWQRAKHKDARMIELTDAVREALIAAGVAFEDV